MSDFFTRLKKQNKINGFCELWDWFIDIDSLFLGWSSGNVGSFTKKVKKLFTECSVFKLKNSDVSLEDEKNKKKLNYYIMTVDSSEGKCLVRHIRNSIAHGRANLIKSKNKECVELIDRNKNGVLTCFMIIEFKKLFEIKEIYNKQKDYQQYKNSKGEK